MKPIQSLAIAVGVVFLVTGATCGHEHAGTNAEEHGGKEAEHGGKPAGKEHGGKPAGHREHGGRPASDEHGGLPAKGNPQAKSTDSPLMVAEHGGRAAKEHGGKPAKRDEHGGKAAKESEHGGDAAKESEHGGEEAEEEENEHGGSPAHEHGGIPAADGQSVAQNDRTDFYANEIKQATLDYIKKRSDEKGVFHMFDKKTGETLALKFKKIHNPVRQIDGVTYFACTDFHVVGVEDKLYDLDFWMNPQTGQLEVYDEKIHKEPRKSLLYGWYKKPRYTFINDEVVSLY